MSYKLVLKGHLTKEVTEAFLYYEFQQANLVYKFLHALKETLTVLEKHPLTYQAVYRNFRQIRIIPFPFVLHFEIIEKTVVVYQLFNCRRNPKKRFKKL